MKRPIYLIIFIGLIITVLTIAQIGVGNQISTAGAELFKIQTQIDNLERENAILQEQILEKSSYTNIKEKADELGYAPSKATLNLNAPAPLAMKQ